MRILSQLTQPTAQYIWWTMWHRSGQVRKCFKRLETYTISDNYFRSVSGLPPAPYPECQPSQTALEQNSPNYLTSLANQEVNSILRTLEKPDMYTDGNAMSSQLTPRTPLTNGSEEGYICPADWSICYPQHEKCLQLCWSRGRLTSCRKRKQPLSRIQAYYSGQHQTTMYKSHPRLHTHKVWHYWEIQIAPGQMIHWLTLVNIMDLASAAINVNTMTTPCVQQSVTPVSFASTTQVQMDIPVPPTVNTSIPPVSTTRVPISQIPSVASTTNTLPSSQPQK